MTMTTPTFAHIDLEALKHNLRQVSLYAPHSKILAMIKSNGYGHGLVPVAKALLKANAFGVASLEEAITLRLENINHPITVMRGFSDIQELPYFDQYNLNMVIHSQEQFEILIHTRIKKPLFVWLKIDTGMNRLGFHPPEVANIYKKLMHHPQIQKPMGLMTHLGCADNVVEQPITFGQLSLFEKTTVNLHGLTSIANSAAILGYPSSHVDYVRPGIMLYGVSPIKDKTGRELGLKPVMTLNSTLIAVKHLHKGERVSYGGTWTCPEDMPIGIAAIGYGDGYPYHAKSGTPILVNRTQCSLIGSVCMDMLIIDLRNNPHAKYGDPVVLWGEGLPVECIAKSAGTIPYELLCQVGNRVKFKYISERQSKQKGIYESYYDPSL